MPPLDPVDGASNHLKACWVDVTDPREQAYAEKRRQARNERMRVVLKESAVQTLQASEEK
jgi:hypothetical protein